MNTQLPELTWKHGDEEGNGGMQLVVQSKPEPKSVRLWVAHSADKDFRPDRWEATKLTASADGEYVGHVERPATGHVAFFAEATYPFGPIEYNLSTQMRQE